MFDEKMSNKNNYVPCELADTKESKQANIRIPRSSSIFSKGNPNDQCQEIQNLLRSYKWLPSLQNKIVNSHNTQLANPVSYVTPTLDFPRVPNSNTYPTPESRPGTMCKKILTCPCPICT